MESQHSKGAPSKVSEGAWRGVPLAKSFKWGSLGISDGRRVTLLGWPPYLTKSRSLQPLYLSPPFAKSFSFIILFLLHFPLPLSRGRRGLVHGRSGKLTLQRLEIYLEVYFTKRGKKQITTVHVMCRENGELAYLRREVDERKKMRKIYI